MSLAAVVREPAAAPAMRAPSLETIGMTKIFGSLVALEDVSIKVEAGHRACAAWRERRRQVDAGQVHHGLLLAAITARSCSTARRCRSAIRATPALNGIGMVYQHFTLVPSLTGAENLVISRADAPAVIDWKKEMRRLNAFLDRMPFRVPLDVPVSAMAAGEKQKLEILKLLYLDQRLLILDEPTSVLTPGEADEMLGLLRDMTHRKEITVIMITHKFREVTSFCDSVTRAAARPQGRRRRRQGPHHRGHGADDDRRHANSRARRAQRQAAGRNGTGTGRPVRK